MQQLIPAITMGANYLIIEQYRSMVAKVRNTIADDMSR
jgi:hypothetical protein